jgi:hypothetical protein
LTPKGKEMLNQSYKCSISSADRSTNVLTNLTDCYFKHITR